MSGWRTIARLCAMMPGLMVAGCALLAPLPERASLNDRLAVFPTTDLPLKGKVTIYWNDNQIPFIEAEHDEDLAFALGLVHAHLRLGQMEIVRRISQGRLAEMGGPLASEIDQGLRILNFGRAAAEIEAAMPEETRAWLARYVEGVNHLLMSQKNLPQEFTVLGLKREPWTIRDLIAITRLGGTDVNWLVWAGLLELRNREDWPKLWERLVKGGRSSVARPERGQAAILTELLDGISRSGSNSVVVAGSRTETGAAMIASDPHLGLTLPNIWLVGGIKSPSYHAVGIMFPGMPFVAVGRNPWIAWGGTNLRSASSDLIDVSSLAPDQITTRKETVKVRWWFDKEVTVRETPYGPILSDAPQFEGNGKPVALDWMGHKVSDEITAMLRVNRAHNFEQFREALATFSVPGQNMMYADVEGNIGQVLAVRLPARHSNEPKDLVVPLDTARRDWQRIVGINDLPHSYNPPRGWLGSANSRPPWTTPVPIGFFFSPDDRVVRMGMLLDGDKRVKLDDLERLQQDVYQSSAVAMRDALVRHARALNAVPADGPARGLFDRMATWDGHFRKDSAGAVAYEVMVYYFLPAFYGRTLRPDEAEAYLGIGRIKSLLQDDIETAAREAPEKLAAAITEALEKAVPIAKEFPHWGDMHRLGLGHSLGFLPVIGGRYRFGDYPVGGSTDTLMKTSHSPSNERHFTRYGSNARHVSDLADPDRNYFSLIGGQDGWFNSSTFLDQVPLWLDGRYIRVPMRPETVKAEFRHVMTLDGQ